MFIGAYSSTCGLRNAELNESLHTRSADLSLELTSEWDPSIRSLLELQDRSLTSGMRISSAIPEMRIWILSTSVALIEDAIHVMSPSSEVGAVAALNDVYTLAQIVDEEGISVESVGVYEGKIRVFPEVYLHRSYVVGEKMMKMPPYNDCKEID